MWYKKLSLFQYLFSCLRRLDMGFLFDSLRHETFGAVRVFADELATHMDIPRDTLRIHRHPIDGGGMMRDGFQLVRLGPRQCFRRRIRFPLLTVLFPFQPQEFEIFFCDAGMRLCAPRLARSLHECTGYSCVVQSCT
jgi:hypothetical protein